MNEFRISNTGTTQLFRSKVLERLSRTPFMFPVSLYYLIGAVCITYAVVYTELNMWELLYCSRWEWWLSPWWNT